MFIPTQSVICLVKPLGNIHGNITGDSWAEKHGLTYLLSQKRNEITPNFLGNTCHGFTKYNTLVHHVPKKAKL